MALRERLPRKRSCYWRNWQVGNRDHRETQRRRKTEILKTAFLTCQLCRKCQLLFTIRAEGLQTRGCLFQWARRVSCICFPSLRILRLKRRNRPRLRLHLRDALHRRNLFRWFVGKPRPKSPLASEPVPSMPDVSYVGKAFKVPAEGRCKSGLGFTTLSAATLSPPVQHARQPMVLIFPWQ